MDMYRKVQELDEWVRTQGMPLVQIVDEMRKIGADRLTRTQLEAATKVNEPAEGDCVPGHFAGLLGGLAADAAAEPVLEGDEIPVTPEAVDAASDALTAIDVAFGITGNEVVDCTITAGAVDEREAETHTPEPEPAPAPPVKRGPGRPKTR